VLFLPSHRAELKAPPTFIGFFDQLKQEFVSARFLYYDGIMRIPTIADTCSD
jgi:hypothetical protein